MKKFLIGSLLLLAGTLSARPHEFKDTGWWTGPIFAAHARAIPANSFILEPYLFYIATTGNYNNSWHSESASPFFSISPQMYVAVGIWKDVDFSVNFVWLDNTYRGHNSSGISDTSVQLAYQVMADDYGGSKYDLLLFVREYLPTGKFDNLRPNTEGADAMGFGAYITSVGINAQKTYLLDNKRLMRMRYNVLYLLPAHVHVDGFNAYGGGYGTNGRVYVGPTFSIIAAPEIQITQNWVFTCDFEYEHGWAATFRGTPGTIPEGTRLTPRGSPAFTGYPAWDFFGITPAIEYNFNANYGLIAGIWVSVAGRNTASFISPVIAFNAIF